METDVRYVYRRRASRITVLAHLFGLLAIILLLVWLLHYRGGIEYDSDNPTRVFNVHPLLMFLGIVFLGGQAMMAYNTLPAARENQKFMHMTLHLIAIIIGIVGLCAVFRYHDMIQAIDVYSLHSWIGITTFSLYCLQWLFGFITFMFPRASERTRYRAASWHVSAGRALFYMAICAALTGLMEKFCFLINEQKMYVTDYQARLINFTGLAILLFGVFVDFSVGIAHYG